jgi:hypothetical protein
LDINKSLELCAGITVYKITRTLNEKFRRILKLKLKLTTIRKKTEKHNEQDTKLVEKQTYSTKIESTKWKEKKLHILL